MTTQVFECWDDEEEAPYSPKKIEAMNVRHAAEKFAEAEISATDWAYSARVDVAVRSPSGELNVYEVRRRVSFDAVYNADRTASLREDHPIVQQAVEELKAAIKGP